MSNTTAYVRPEGDSGSLDTLAVVPVAEVPGRKLRAGMILTDRDLDTPAAEIDHFSRGPRNSGSRVVWYRDLDTKRFESVLVHGGSLIRVMAKS